MEILVVASKVKKLVKEKGDMATSAAVYEELTRHIEKICLGGIEKAKQDGRKTLMDRDIECNCPATTEEEILVVASKAKKYIKEQGDINTSGAVVGVLSACVKEVCLKGIEHAKADGRKTLMDRDITVPCQTCC